METERTFMWYALTVAFGVLVSCATLDEKDRKTEVASQAPRKPSSSPRQPSAFVQPTTVFQCTKIGNVSFLIQRGADSCIQNIKSYENATCAGTGETIDADKNFAKNRVFIGPLAGNDLCAETVTVSTGSPCFIVEFDSGGDHYTYCYHESKKINCSLIGPPPSGICESHP